MFIDTECQLLKVLTHGRPVRMIADAFTRKDGSILPVAYSAAPLLSGTNVDGVVVVFHDASDERAAQERVQRELDSLAWIGRIREALDEDRMILYSQPIVPLRGGRPSEELLLRIRGLDGTVLSPTSFIPVAEKYGMIAEIDRWVIVQAIQLASRGKVVEANLSAHSIATVDLLPFIERQLEATHTDPANLVFEITESALVQNLRAGEAFAHGLAAIDCGLAFDDFGTGYGSLSHLKTIPLKYLKIDIEFVKDLTSNRANQHLVETIVHLARGFGYETIAEGVEDEPTLALLDKYGVDYVQAFTSADLNPSGSLLPKGLERAPASVQR
jgi:EAL domain-containing protein (putative c-di-GMP-specific phosphodiesterase class I)